MNNKYKKMIIIFGLIILTLGVGIAYSAFNSSSELESNQQNIAKFIFDAKRLDEIQLPLVDLNPGDNKEYPFSVSNNNLQNTSNVKVQYQITIKTYHFVPLSIELYKLNNEVEQLVLTCDENFERNSNNELVCNAPIQELGYSGEELNNYKLKVNFPSNNNDELYSNLVDYINLEIKSWQKQ
jgi:hypothetical protein